MFLFPMPPAVLFPGFPPAFPHELYTISVTPAVFPSVSGTSERIPGSPQAPVIHISGNMDALNRKKISGFCDSYPKPDILPVFCHISPAPAVFCSGQSIQTFHSHGTALKKGAGVSADPRSSVITCTDYCRNSDTFPQAVRGPGHPAQPGKRHSPSPRSWCR